MKGSKADVVPVQSITRRVFLNTYLSEGFYFYNPHSLPPSAKTESLPIIESLPQVLRRWLHGIWLVHCVGEAKDVDGMVEGAFQV